MQGEGKRPCSQPLHEQLSLPAGIHPLSTPQSSLTTPLPLKKKKLLKVILKSPPTPNPNRLSPSLSSSPSSPPPPSPSSLSTPSLLPPHHHHLQQHQLHHHQQLLLQQQHLHKQKLLHQQTQQLASELQLKLHQQHLLQQEHPKLLEQFKQQLEQEQICVSSPDLQGNLQEAAVSGSRDRRRNLKGQSSQQEISESQEKGRSTQEERRNASSGRRRGRSRDFSSDALPEEQFALRKSRFHSEGEANFGHILQGDAQTPLKEFYSNGQEQPSLQMQENFHRDGEPSSKRLKISEQHIEEYHHVRNPLRSPTGHCNNVANAGYNGLHNTQKPLPNGVLSSPRLASVSSSAAILEASDTKRLHQAANTAVSIAPHLLAKPVSEGIRRKDGTATGPSSKTLGGSGNTSVPGRKMLRGILDKLQKKDSYGAFSEPVDAKEVPDYYDVIKEPMDFGTMRKRISSGFYTSLELFEKDIFAICSNAMTFNATGTVYHRQARAIKAAAERILEPLKTPGSARADEGSLKHKVGVPQVKKSHKKKQPWKPWTSDYVSEPLPNLDGRGTGRASAPYLADSYYVDWQAGIGQTANKMNTDDKDDALGYLAKSLGLNEGRRFLLNEESRRSTYKPISNAGSGSLVTTVGGGPLQFVPAAFQLDFSYARSLARFAADLGPDVWKVVGEKIRRALPVGVPFGPGWVGQRESPGRAFSLPNKSPASGSMDPQGKVQNVLNEAGVLATADVQRIGSSGVTGSASGAADSKGIAVAIDQNSLANDYRTNQQYVEELRPREPLHFSHTASQGLLDGGMRHAHHGVRQKEIAYHSQAACQGGAGESGLLSNCDGDVVFIPGRDLEGRGFVDYKNAQPSLLHLDSGSALISAPVALIEGIQPRLNEDG